MFSTKDRVIQFFRTRPRVWYKTAQIAEDTGLSFTTVNRYLREMERCGILKIQQQYGCPGHPKYMYLYIEGLQDGMENEIDHSHR